MLGAEEVDVKADSQVIINQVLGQFVEKGDRLKKYLQLVCNERDHLVLLDPASPKSGKPKGRLASEGRVKPRGIPTPGIDRYQDN